MEKRKKKRSPFRIVMTILLALALVAAFFITAERYLDIHILSDILPSGDDTEFDYTASGSSNFAVVGNSLAVISPLELTLYNKDGGEVLTEYCHISQPAITSAGKYGAAYDSGGAWLCYFTEKGAMMTLEEDKIISARADTSGYLAVCATDSGYLGKVEIFNGDGIAVYRWQSGNDYPFAAAADGSGFTAACLGEGGSRVVWYGYDSEECKGQWETDSLVYDLYKSGKTTVAVCEDAIVFLSDNGEETGRYDLADKYLQRSAFYKGRVAAVTGEHRLSEERSLILLDSTGNELAQIPCSRDISDVEISGGYILALYPEQIEVYSDDLELLGVKSGVDGAAKVQMSRDGTVFAVGQYSATTFSPRSITKADASEK